MKAFVFSTREFPVCCSILLLLLNVRIESIDKVEAGFAPKKICHPFDNRNSETFFMNLGILSVFHPEEQGSKFGSWVILVPSVSISEPEHSFKHHSCAAGN